LFLRLASFDNFNREIFKAALPHCFAERRVRNVFLLSAHPSNCRVKYSITAEFCKQSHDCGRGERAEKLWRLAEQLNLAELFIGFSTDLISGVALAAYLLK